MDEGRNVVRKEGSYGGGGSDDGGGGGGGRCHNENS